MRVTRACTGAATATPATTASTALSRQPGVLSLNSPIEVSSLMRGIAARPKTSLKGTGGLHRPPLVPSAVFSRSPPWSLQQISSLQDIARFGRLDQRIAVRRQQETLPLGLGRGPLDGAHVALVGAIALFERKARVAVDHPLGLGLRERNPATLVVAVLADVEAGSDHVPSQVRAERSHHQHDRDTAHFV